MKEVIAIIRMNNVNQTKKALENAGFTNLTCRKVLGRGKNKADFEIASGKPVLNKNGTLNGELVTMSARIGQIHTLMPKRLFIMVVHDEDVKKVVDIFLEVNSRGNPGDGKIFVVDVDDALSIRTMDQGERAI